MTNNDAIPEYDLAEDFIEEYDVALNSINKVIDELVDKKASADDIASLFRQTHSIKSNLRMVNLNYLSDVVHHLENLLDKMRRQEIAYSPKIGDILSLTLDEVKVEAIRKFEKKPSSKEVSLIANVIEHICEALPANRPEAIQIALNLLNPFNDQQAEAETKNSESEEKESLPELSIYQYIDSDLEFFKHLGQISCARLGYLSDRIELTNRIALYMNKEAGNPVICNQLTAAAYAHVVGLAQIPLSITQKRTELSEEEKQIFSQHPNLSANFLNKLPFWKTAANIVLQYKERIDGEGYPNKLKEDDICDGAKILSLAAAFEDKIHERKLNNLYSSSRTVIAVIMEINQESTAKFSQFWTDIFNRATKKLHTEKKLIR